MTVQTAPSSATTMEADEFDLFGGLVSEPETEEFAVPENLQEYDFTPSNQMVREAGEQVFLRWLKAEMAGREVLPPAPTEPVVCEDTPEMFFPNWPEPEDYALGEEDPELLRVQHEEYLKVLAAKAACSACPLAKECLSAAVIRGEEFGVWGGWGEASRERVTNQFHRMRRDYNSGRMTRSVSHNYERIAREL